MNNTPGQITVEDFDKAIAVPWSPKTCVLAQCADRLQRKLYDAQGELTPLFLNCNVAISFMHRFDVIFLYGIVNKPDKVKLAELRSQLPINLE